MTGLHRIQVSAMTDHHEGPVVNERRDMPRRKALKGGKVVFNNHGSIFDCAIRNLSKSGALIILPNAIAIPNEFELKYDGVMPRCAVKWRRIDRLGIGFFLE